VIRCLIGRRGVGEGGDGMIGDCSLLCLLSFVERDVEGPVGLG